MWMAKVFTHFLITGMCILNSSRNIIQCNKLVTITMMSTHLVTIRMLFSLKKCIGLNNMALKCVDLIENLLFSLI